MSAAGGLAGHVGVLAACRALGVARATFYRRRRPKTGQRQSRPAPARALDAAERAEVFRVLCSPRFADRAPAEVYATLCGACPLPASSGETRRHRLNRGGNRQANPALHMIVVYRMRTDQRTRDYVERRTREGLSKREVMRCLKCYVAREVYRAPEVIEQRQNVLAAAYAARPDRFVVGPPRATQLPAEVWINRALPVAAANGADPVGGGTEGSLT